MRGLYAIICSILFSFLSAIHSFIDQELTNTLFDEDDDEEEEEEEDGEPIPGRSEFYFSHGSDNSLHSWRLLSCDKSRKDNN